MDRRERYNDAEEMLRSALAGFQAGLWTATPGIVQSFDPEACTVVIQPSIKARVTNEDGSISTVALPLLLDCPVVFQRGGGFTLTFPVAAGDEALVVFASRCIDSWWQSGGVQEQAELRMHDLSDGFALVGPFSRPSVIPDISTGAAQLRSDDGTSFVEVNDDTITIETTASVTVNAPDVIVNCETAEVNASDSLTVDSPQSTFTGAVTVEGLLTYEAGLAGAGGGVGSTITGNLVQTGGVLSSEGTVLHTHTHGGVQTGGGNTGAPN